jgi:hypothetical protein
MPPYSGSQQFNSVADAAQQVQVSAGGQSFNLNDQALPAGHNAASTRGGLIFRRRGLESGEPLERREEPAQSQPLDLDV